MPAKAGIQKDDKIRTFPPVTIINQWPSGSDATMNVVIVAPEGVGGIAGDFRRWTDQYVNKDPKQRKMVTIAAIDRDAVVAATQKAARLAGGNGRVIYAVGHGWGTTKRPQVGNADFGPNGILRVTEYVAFYHPTSSQSGCEMKTIAEDFDVAKAKHKNPALKRWCAKYKVKGKDCELLKKKVGNRSTVQPYYDRIAAVFRNSSVGRVLLLSCEIGQSTEFLDELSTDFGVPVGAYRRTVMAVPDKVPGVKGKPPVRVFLEGDRKGTGTNTAEALTELMPGSDSKELNWGSVVKGEKVQCKDQGN
jgi:hypothetical protein